jgi:Bacterial PH domain
MDIFTARAFITRYGAPMQTLDHIQAQINALPEKYIFFTGKEIRYLPEVLADNERILALTSGFMNGKTWLGVCTDRRVIFLDRGIIYGLNQLQMNLDRIQSIDSHFGLIFGSIRVWDGATAMNISLVLRSTIPHFVKTVQEAMDAYKRTLVLDVVKQAQAMERKAGATSSPSDSHDFIHELERLSALHTSGKLSDTEFEAAKRKLLG